MKHSERQACRKWAIDAIKTMNEAMGDTSTPLHEFPVPKEWGVKVILKDESVLASGSLKHRLAASLISFGICNGDITQHSTLVDASSGSTAVSEAFYAKALGLPFVAVVPSCTSPKKLQIIEESGGKCYLCEPGESIYNKAAELGAQDNWVYLDQFTNASLRTNWRSDNLASALFQQLAATSHEIPAWVIVGAGTGGTASTIARYSRYHGLDTQLCVVDPEGSAYYEAWKTNSREITGPGSRIEGIGRPRVEPSFIPSIVDEVLPIPDRASVAGMVAMRDRGFDVGASTGTNIIGTLAIAYTMYKNGISGTIASIICDRSDRYQDSYCSNEWLDESGLAPCEYLDELNAWLDGGEMPSWVPVPEVN
ncbi:hypothetical protein BSZ39_11740 [Bowdeniella nasicola]|uniref:Tryptophan synthase beta chain-like PALP domain-containing protein n=1 Tax=Bowdeniella nasicola TaxID=208480 RepID=A0A1Q5PZF2_9ACTO|nr:pyridoxal-phosphate dependent enzyme [Bowdeniella nasicola]OKL53013.1 hypothetical protein BSZ39_11740 [Bowdeniella nasicola]